MSFHVAERYFEGEEGGGAVILCDTSVEQTVLPVSISLANYTMHYQFSMLPHMDFPLINIYSQVNMINKQIKYHLSAFQSSFLAC